MKKTSPALGTFVTFLLTAVLSSGQASEKGKTKSQPQPYAIVAGTVFRDPGFVQPGAKVVLALKSNPAKAILEQTSDARGEFAFRVPAGQNIYVVTATLKGFKPAGQDVEILSQEQINATLLLVPESKR